jgi:integrase
MSNSQLPAPLRLPPAQADLERVAAEQAVVRADVARAANVAGANHVFRDYLERLSHESLRRVEADLALFARFLAEVQAIPSREEVRVGAELLYHPHRWQHISWGLVKAFVAWMLKAGYAIDTVNIRLTTIKTFARLAMQAGTIAEDDYQKIAALRGYGGRAARNVDEKRETTRVGAKKAEPVLLRDDQVEQLKQQPDTPVGRRDRLLVCLLFEHGLRVGEVEALTVGAFDLRTGLLTFYREKVDLTQVHRLSDDTYRAARAYLLRDRMGAAASELAFLGSRKDGQLVGTFGDTSMRRRITQLGEAIGVSSLSPHDGRHYWATAAARAGTPIGDLRDAGGWSSFEMPSHYVERSTVANEGVRRAPRGTASRGQLPAPAAEQWGGEPAGAVIARLRAALSYYTTASYVSSWGYQEVEDDGSLARAVLASTPAGDGDLAAVTVEFLALLEQARAAEVRSEKLSAALSAAIEAEDPAWKDISRAADQARQERDALQMRVEQLRQRLAGLARSAEATL